MNIPRKPNVTHKSEKTRACGSLYSFPNSGFDITMIVTMNATKTSNPTGRKTPNKTSPTLSAKSHIYTEDITATANQQLATMDAL